MNGEGIDTSGKALIDFWLWAAEKGLMKPNTAKSLRAACSQVIAALENWQTLDVRGIDVEDTFRRFVNKRSQDFTPDSLEAYKRRFAQAVKGFLHYADNPAGWRFAAREITKRDRKANATDADASDEATTVSERPTAIQPIVSGLVEYPFPLREGRLAYLRLPMDLKMAEVKRLTAYLTTLAVDAS